MGIRRRLKKPKTLEPQSMPRERYIGFMNRGKAAANPERRKVFAAIAEAE